MKVGGLRAGGAWERRVATSFSSSTDWGSTEIKPNLQPLNVHMGQLSTWLRTRCPETGVSLLCTDVRRYESLSSWSESFAIERVFANIDVIVVGVGHDAAILEPWNRDYK
jgi:hypothetical protein